MKILLIIISLQLYVFSKAQLLPENISRVTSYTIYSNFGKEIDTAWLVESDSLNIFFINNHQNSSAINEIKDANGYKVVIQNPYIFSFVHNTLQKKGYFVDDVFSKKVSLFEDPPLKLEWSITGNAKKINNNIEVFEAVTEFRGRKYRAWFCPSIKSSVGPWKMHGLPGLILELEDFKGFFSIRYNKFIDTNTVNLNFIKSLFESLSLASALPLEIYVNRVNLFIKKILLANEQNSDCINCETKFSSHIEMLEYF